MASEKLTLKYMISEKEILRCGRELQDSNRDNRVKASWILAKAAEAGVNITPILLDLITALGDPIDNVRGRCEYALQQSVMHGTIHYSDVIKTAKEIQIKDPQAKRRVEMGIRKYLIKIIGKMHGEKQIMSGKLSDGIPKSPSGRKGLTRIKRALNG